jgi:putative addiction module component (TIGR02574 family)
MLAILEIEKTLLALPAEQRVQLAESLLDSLPPAGELWSEAEDLVEVERRERQIESGEVQPLSEAEFWRRVAMARKG